MKTKILILLSVIFTLTNCNFAYAQNAITCSATAEGNPVIVSGQITNANANTNVTILVSENENVTSDDEIIYINQKRCNSDGTFKFEFRMPDGIPYGSYVYKIGSDADTGVYQGVLEYTEAPIIERRQFIDADVDVVISGYVPTITGTVYCSEGKTVTLNITNTTDDTVIESDTITSESGVFNLNYTLPSLFNPKEYAVVMSCMDNETNLANINVTIDSDILSVDIVGSATTADNVEIEAQMQTVNTDLVNKDTLFTGSEDVSVTIPNILSNASFHLAVQGYETVKIYPLTESVEHIVGATAGDDVYVYIGYNTDDYSNKIFKLTYPSDKLTLEDACSFTLEKNTEIGEVKNTNVVIHEISAGKIDFKINNSVNITKIINGLIFKKLTDDKAIVKCVISEE